MIYQPSLFAHINSRYHAFKSKVRTDSQSKTAQFRSWYMDIIQMVFTLIRTTLHCMSALSVCLVPIVHYTRSQQLRTLCTCVTDYITICLIHIADAKHFWNKMGLMLQSLVLCLSNAFDIAIRQTLNPKPSQRRYYGLQQLELRFELQMEWWFTHYIRAQYIETTLQCTEMKYSICSDAK